MSPLKQPRNQGFTIVELLIVIVVIGILAAITVVAYSGIQTSAGVVVLKSDLNQAQTQLELDRINNSTYPTTKSGLPKSDGTNYEYTKTGNDYCLTASSDRAKTSFHINSTNGAIADGPCSGDTGYSGGGEVAFDQPNDCPTGFIPVPGNSLFSTEGGFCVMKYEAKQVGSSTTPISTASGTPWVSINQTTAIANSTNVAGCTSCHLITEAEWLTIAHNVLSVDSNWSGSSVGSGYIYSGHNDNAPASALAADSNDANGYSGETNTGGNQRRTLTLSNGAIIWDLAGNVWEWTNATSTTGQPGSSGYGWREWNALATYGSFSNANPSYGTPAASGWTSAQGIGRIFSNLDETALRGFLRSGTWYFGGGAGVLTLLLNFAPSSAGSPLGFRVAR